MAHLKPCIPKRKRTRFLDLPGELRNLIYQFYFEGGLRSEIVARGVELIPKPVKSIKLCVFSCSGRIMPVGAERRDNHGALLTLRTSRLLGNYMRVHGVNTNWRNSFCALILVCKQLQVEVLPSLYNLTTFAFAAPRRISNFLTHVPKSCLKWISKLHLHYANYGPPETRFLAWKTKHANRWTQTFKQISKELPNLSELRIWLHVTESPLHFDLRQTWVQPLMQFRRLTRPRNESGIPKTQPQPSLTNIHVTLTSRWTKRFIWDNPELEDVCKDLHRLFADAIARAMLGWPEADAMVEYLDAWKGRYQPWQHHLKFSALF
ncbi:hypothetical protein K432DRAFT_427099 [Lepidopterella palustris CBS 459.81]|uniref:DUF7730 domain-containing protein n=1 Tax=Lepidopterella palustris CBS 459.81 TaxID=1314670 RepID=A0A8E2E796_9PEZI|nr:hypothetical protein K432DRAFT_427099 [Lepidopterella palustris CBS 459.81]